MGIPASLRIAEESEASTLKLELLNKLIDEAYMGIYQGVKDFPSLAENFIAERDDKLIEILLSLYDKIKNIGGCQTMPSGFIVVLEKRKKQQKILIRGGLKWN